MALPDLKPLIHHPDTVILKVALDTITKINDALFPFETQVYLVLESKRIDGYGEKQSSRKHKNVVVTLHHSLNKE